MMGIQVSGLQQVSVITTIGQQLFVGHASFGALLVYEPLSETEIVFPEPKSTLSLYQDTFVELDGTDNSNVLP